MLAVEWKYLLHQRHLSFPSGQSLDLLGHALQLLCVEQHVAGPRWAHVYLQSKQLRQGSVLAKGFARCSMQSRQLSSCELLAVCRRHSTAERYISSEGIWCRFASQATLLEMFACALIFHPEGMLLTLWCQSCYVQM